LTQVVLERLRKTYRDRDRDAARDVLAIQGIDLAIVSGELISLLGPSGCGKTTTLRCIAGFETPDAGAIRFDGEDIVARPPEERDIGLVFQNYALFPHMTVRENIGFGLEMRKVPKATIQRRVLEVLDMVQLGSHADRYPRQLSGGQQQRVALARALVIEPRVLLLDEPLANLDAKLRDEMRFFIRSLQQRVGITTVYVTHDQAEAMVMSDRVVVMFDGTISQCATPAEIYQRPATRQVANFVGLSNFISGQVVGREGGKRRRVQTALGMLQGVCDSGFDTGDDTLVVVRPENIALHSERPPGDNVFRAEMREMHYLGHTSEFRLACADGSIVQVHQNTALPTAPGTEVWLSFPEERCWLVPPGAQEDA
jgi:putative spermidine/putrescine transport system ATP-binding protein